MSYNDTHHIIMLYIRSTRERGRMSVNIKSTIAPGILKLATVTKLTITVSNKIIDTV